MISAGRFVEKTFVPFEALAGSFCLASFDPKNTIAPSIRNYKLPDMYIQPRKIVASK